MCKAVQDILNTKDPIAPPRPVPSSNLSAMNWRQHFSFNLLEYSTEPSGHPTQSRNNPISVSQKATLVNW